MAALELASSLILKENVVIFDSYYYNNKIMLVLYTQ